ncbi:MAG TPA: pilus assembly protein PilM [Candidatus Saccharimonadales bacterium]|jgi:type IV pilus assembly protein PilM
MSKYFYKDKPVVGLDISQTGLKIMAINPHKSTVLGYGSLEVDPAKLQQSLDGDGEYLGEQLKTLLDKKIVGHLPSNHTVMSIPTSRTYSRSISLPIDLKGDMLEAVRLEAEQFIPIPIDQLYLDYEITQRTKDGVIAHTSAAPRRIVDTCMAAAAHAGLRTVLVEPSIHAIARVLRSSEQGHLPTVIVDITAASTDVAILDGTIKVTGVVAVGGNTLTVEIADLLKVSMEKAHQLKILSGLSQGPKQAKLQTAVKPTLDKILSEVRKVVRYYEERVAGAQKLEQVLILGSGSNMPGLGEYFTDHLMLASRVASPWQELDFGRLAQPARQHRPRYISVAGLALVPPKEIWS